MLRERNTINGFRKKTIRQEPKVGDVVLVGDDVKKRRQWKLAKIIQIQRSEDNAVRSVVLQLGTGTKIVRPVQSIFYMELNEFQDQELPIPGDNGQPNDIANIQNDI